MKPTKDSLRRAEESCCCACEEGTRRVALAIDAAVADAVRGMFTREEILPGLWTTTLPSAIYQMSHWPDSREEVDPRIEEVVAAVQAARDSGNGDDSKWDRCGIGTVSVKSGR
jgi:hypothetical protein